MSSSGINDRRTVGPQLGIFAVLWFGLAFAGREAMLGDPGSFWHIEVGRILDSQRRMVQLDPFSFTKAGEPWIAMQWLGEWGMYRIWNCLGFDGLLVVAISILAWTYGVSAGRFLRAGCHWLLAAAMVFLVLAASSHHFLIRPHLVSISLVAWTMRWIIDFETGRQFQRFSPAVVFAVFVFWTNVHAGALGGVITMALATAGWILARVTGWPIGLQNRGQLPSAMLAAGLAAIAVFVNPYGVELPKVWLSLSSSQALQNLIVEHARLNPLALPDVFVLVLAAIYLTVLLGVPLKQWRVSWLLAFPWLLMACDRIRHAPLFAVVVATILPEMLGQSRPLLRLSQSGSDLFNATVDYGWRSRWLENWTCSVFSCLALLCVWSVRGTEPNSDRTIWAQPNPKFAPVSMLPALRRATGGFAEGTPVFNDLNLGGFVIHFVPKCKVFVDDRCELYGPDFLRDYCDARTDHPDRLDAWIAKYQPKVALVEYGGRFDDRLRNHLKWRLVAESPTAAAFTPPAP